MSGTTALGNISLALAAGLLNHGFGAAAMPMPSMLFVGLFTSTVGNGVEVSGGGYARQNVSFGITPPIAPVTVKNAADVIWPPMGMQPWGTIIAGGIFDSPLLGGNFYGWGSLVAPDGVTPIEVPMTVPGAIFRIPAGQLVVGIT